MKNKHILTLLSKPIGYIMEFKLWYRSSVIGNTSMFDFKKIYFNETTIK